MKILITGGKGQLAQQIYGIIKKGSSDLGIMDEAYKNAELWMPDADEMDITNLEEVKQKLTEFNPEIIINCAAMTNVDGCESNEELAFTVNALGARNLAIVCENIGARLIHISTDYVFKGEGQIPYKEYDMTAPASVYGKSKLLGENYVREFCRKYFIVRTSWLYGHGGSNFVKTIIKAAREKGELQVVNDQRGNPTYAEDLAHHILKLALTEEYGIYHCTGNGECSWYDFARAIVEYANINCRVEPITSEKLNRAAKRPSFSSLDNMMLRCTIGDEMREWTEALRSFINS